MPISTISRAAVPLSAGRAAHPWRLPEPHRPSDIRSELVRAGDVGGGAAWQILIRDGLLAELWHGVAASPTVPVTAELRARAVRDLIPTHTTLGGLSAVWILTGGSAPATLDVIYPPGTHRPPATLGRAPRQAHVLADERVLVGKLAITAPLRTVLDVATRVPKDDALAAIRVLTKACGVDLEAARRSLDLRFRWPRRDHARAVLAQAA